MVPSTYRRGALRTTRLLTRLRRSSPGRMTASRRAPPTTMPTVGAWPDAIGHPACTAGPSEPRTALWPCQGGGDRGGTMHSLVDGIVVGLKTSIFLNVLALGMSARASNMTFVLHQPWVLLRSIFAMNVIMPVMAAALVEAFNLRPALKVALLAVSLSPIPPLLPRRELQAGGKA